MESQYGSISHTETSVFTNTSNSADTATTIHEDTQLFQTFDSIFKTVLGTISVLFNFTTFVAVCFSKRLHTVPHVCVASLAVSDLIVSIFSGTGSIVKLAECRNGQIASCRCVYFFLNGFAVIHNLLNHLIISSEQWLYIARPFLHQRIITRRSTVCSLIILWILSGMVNLNLLVDHSQCNIFQKKVNFGIICPAFHFSLSLVMFSVYSHIAVIARRQIRLINKTRPVGVFDGHHAVTTTRTSVQSSLRTVRLLVTVFGTFFILMTPGICSDVYAYVKDKQISDTVAVKTLDIMYYSHNCTNFIIFAVQDRVFRDVIKQSFVVFVYWICQTKDRTVSFLVRSRKQ